MLASKRRNPSINGKALQHIEIPASCIYCRVWSKSRTFKLSRSQELNRKWADKRPRSELKLVARVSPRSCYSFTHRLARIPIGPGIKRSSNLCPASGGEKRCCCRENWSTQILWGTNVPGESPSSQWWTLQLPLRCSEALQWKGRDHEMQS